MCALILFSAFVTGCNSPKAVPLIDKDDITLNIGYLSEEAFEQRYANILQREYPKLRVNIIPMKELIRGEVTVQQWVKSHSVDLLYIPDHLFESFIDSGQIRQLDAYIDRDSYSLDDRVPEAIELTKLYGTGKIYGLPPTFTGRALAYNKDLFDQYNVSYPKDGMSWNELITLSQRFPQGLSITDRTPWDWVQDMGMTLNLQLYNKTSRTVTFNSPSWLKVWESAIEPLRNNKVWFDDINKNPFRTGERAMTIISSDQLRRLEEGQLGFKWDLVTMPVNPAQPDVTANLFADGFYAVTQTSSNPDDAWEVMRFLLSDRVAKWVYGDWYGFTTLADQLGINAEEKKHRAVFHRLRPVLPNYDVLPDSLRGLAIQTLDQLLAGSDPITESSLTDLQQKAEALLRSDKSSGKEK
ncbi:ABC transporter substrate-binding protein [Cohnella silvisoli]|uniref:Extracellular solute-binding protein n=1 Tax=Cohnella silvisoli TaxID=2873699 RepID=A0ABV1KL47_9BACL|nr:extracellular solute-binding protein [Cohnella silvisoli]MCD9020800.1 extracellular solute-binding protein [Cohnella silvisoli]